MIQVRHNQLHFQARCATLLHVPSLCGTLTLPSWRLQPGESWEGCFWLVPISSAFIKYRRISKGQTTRSKWPSVRKQLQMKNTALSKPIGFKSCLKKKKSNKQAEYFSAQNPFLWAAGKQGYRRLDKLPGKAHLVSYLLWLRTDKGFPRLLIRL